MILWAPKTPQITRVEAGKDTAVTTDSILHRATASPQIHTMALLQEAKDCHSHTTIAKVIPRIQAITDHRTTALPLEAMGLPQRAAVPLNITAPQQRDCISLAATHIQHRLVQSRLLLRAQLALRQPSSQLRLRSARVASDTPHA